MKTWLVGISVRITVQAKSEQEARQRSIQILHRDDAGAGENKEWDIDMVEEEPAEEKEVAPAEEIIPSNMTREDVQPGVSVIVRTFVERYPSCMLERGETGVVQEVRPDIVRVKMDRHVPGLEEWGNCVECYAQGVKSDAIDAFLSEFDKN